jgi:PAS domain S-box-containing protein
MKRHSLFRLYLWLVVLAGALIGVWCVARLPVTLNWPGLILAAVTLCLGRRLIVQIPQGNGEITVTDTLVFLTLFLYGGEAATLLAAAEATISRAAHNKKLSTFLFAGATLACSTFAATQVVRFFLGPETLLAGAGFTPRFALGVGLLGLAQFFVNTVLVALGVGLKNGQSVWHVWSRFYLWSSVIYFAGAAAAGITAQLVSAYGFIAALVVAPVVAVVYFTYRMYLQNVAASLAQAEQARRYTLELQASHERFHGAFDHAPIGIALMHRSGECWQVNRAWRELCQYERDAPPRKLQEILHAEDVPACLKYVAALGLVAAPPAPLEARIVKPDNSVAWVALNASPLHDARSGDDYLVVQMQDITERKHAEETLRQSERLKTALLDAVTHDLRTPLTSIKASVTTLLGEFEEQDDIILPGDVRQELLDVIDEEADRLNSIIAGHIGLARLETGALGLHRFQTELHEIVRIVQARVAGLTRAHEVVWGVAATLPPVQADTHAVAEVLYLLIDNAAKYTPLRARIQVRGWQETPDFVHLAVEDTGAGIPANLREKVFEKFFRVPSPGRAVSGTGLGLAIARGIVEAHDGRIWIEDGAHGKGTRVVFTLPVSGEMEGDLGLAV